MDKSLTDLDIEAILGSMAEDQREHHYRDCHPSYLKLRSIVVEWILDVAEHFELHPTTSHAAVCYLDRIQPNEKFCLFQWQMVAVSCITIAAKYNEMEEDVPDLHSLGGLIGQDIPFNVALDYELWVLKLMGWKLNARTPLAFLCCYMSVGILCPSEIASHSTNLSGGHVEYKEVHRMLTKHATTLANLCILDMQFKAYPASLLAAAILYLSRRNVGLQDPWRPELSSLTSLDPVSFEHLVGELETAAVDILSRLQDLHRQRQIKNQQRRLAEQAIQRQQRDLHKGGLGEESHLFGRLSIVTPEHSKALGGMSGKGMAGKPSPDSVADMLCS